MPRFWLLLSVISATTLSGCGLFRDCHRDGCDAVISRVPDDGSTGIAGNIAAQSDKVENGCQNCPFGEATVTIYRASMPVTDALSARVAVANATPNVVDADKKFAATSDPGNYVVCVGSSCVAVEVVQSHWTTVHVVTSGGPASFLVFDPRSGYRVSVPTFDFTP